MHPHISASILPRPSTPEAELSSNDTSATHQRPNGLLCIRQQPDTFSRNLGMMLPLALLELRGGSPLERRWDCEPGLGGAPRWDSYQL